jgi:hypothetical protein
MARNGSSAPEAAESWTVTMCQDLTWLAMLSAKRLKGTQLDGRMFWFMWKKFCGSYLVLSFRSRG